MLRKVHRYIGLLVSIQLLLWTIGGIWFAWNDIESIRGTHLRNLDIKPPTNQQMLSSQIAIDSIDDFASLHSLQVINFINEPAYRINYSATDKTEKQQLINAVTGKHITDITKQQAVQIAKLNANFAAEVANIELITQTGKHHEYRAKPMPAWAVTFDYSGSPTFYVSTKLATLTSVRHTSWRIFDFFWMLHTMDYEGRDDFGNWLIKIFSIIALITAISGIALFIISSRRTKRH